MTFLALQNNSSEKVETSRDTHKLRLYIFIFCVFVCLDSLFVMFGRQILKKFPTSRVLACAPSNSAADLVLQRVMEHTVIPKSQMMRLNAFGRSALSLPKDIKVCYKHDY